MPYQTNKDLPGDIQEKLPEHAQDIYREAFNHAWKEYADPSKRRSNESQEVVSHKVAWTAVETKYTKQDNKWVAKEE